MSAKYSARSVTPIDVLTVELNGLANGANKISVAQPNVDAGERVLFAIFQLVLADQAAARTETSVSLYILPEFGGVYPPGSDTVDPQFKYFRDTFEFDLAATGNNDQTVPIMLPNADFKILIMNETGQAFAASGNTLKMTIYGYEDAA